MILAEENHCSQR